MTSSRLCQGRAVAAVAIVLLAGSGSAACGFKGPAAAQPCDWMSGKASGGRTAFLLDVSNSTRGNGRSGSAPDYATALAGPIDQAVQRLDVVSVAAFSGRASDLVWAVRDLSTDYKAGNDNPDNQQDRKAEAITCAEKAVAAAGTVAPTAPGTDVLGAMKRAVAWLDSGRGSRNLVVATDGLVTTGCADLTKSSFKSQREISTITSLCVQRNEIDPVTLSGVHVTLLGIGRPSSDQPVPTPQQVAWLGGLWQSLCGKTCALDDGPVAGENSGEVAKDRRVPDPPVGFQRDKQVYALPSLFLFDTDSSALKPEAIPVLQDISVSIRTTAYARVDVNGYADPRGDPDHNRALSLRRAESVAQALDPAIGGQPHGMGATRKCPYAMAVSDPANGDDLACARRVEIVVTTKDGR